MNRPLLSLTKIFLGMLPLLLVSLPASAASDLSGVPILPPPSGSPPPPSLQYPFASVNASELANSTPVPHHHRRGVAFRHNLTYRSVLEYRIRFSLNAASDGLAPTGENMLLSAAPDPNDPQAAQTPSFQIAVPNGCFVDMTHHQRHFDVNSLDCGVQVRLHDPSTMMDTSLNDQVRHFRARLSMRRNGTQGELRVRINFVGFNAPANVNPNGILTFTMGNDGVQALPMQAPHHHRGHGRVTLSHS